jgi:hypothetical protein
MTFSLTMKSARLLSRTHEISNASVGRTVFIGWQNRQQHAQAFGSDFDALPGSKVPLHEASYFLTETQPADGLTTQATMVLCRLSF